MIHSFYRLQRVNIGFDPGRRFGVYTHLKWGTPVDVYLRSSARLEEKLFAVPGIKRMALSSAVPLAGESSGTVKIADRPELGYIPCAEFSVSPDYFGTLGLPLLLRRTFEGLKPGDPPVAVINETSGGPTSDCIVTAWGNSPPPTVSRYPGGRSPALC
jgi:hypothetical protein